MTQMRQVTLANGLWLTLYVALVAAIAWTLTSARERVLVDLATPGAQTDWDAWRDAAQKQTSEGPVRRRPPKSAEPPALVLLRDHFPVVLTASIVLSSLLFATLMIVLRGAISHWASATPIAKEPSVRRR